MRVRVQGPVSLLRGLLIDELHFDVLLLLLSLDEVLFGDDFAVSDVFHAGLGEQFPRQALSEDIEELGQSEEVGRQLLVEQLETKVL